MPKDMKNSKICPKCGGTGKDKTRLLISGPIVIIIALLCIYVFKLDTYMNLAVLVATYFTFTIFSKCSTCKGNKKVSINYEREK